jgi:hypothetical protein
VSRLETALTHKILLAHGSRDDCRLFRNATAMVWVGHKIGTVDNGSVLLAPGARPIRAGLTEGSSDIIGIGPGGLFAAIEVKAGSTRDQAHQERFIQMVLRLGGLAGFARSVEEATAIIEGRR